MRLLSACDGEGHGGVARLASRLTASSSRPDAIGRRTCIASGEERLVTSPLTVLPDSVMEFDRFDVL